MLIPDDLDGVSLIELAAAWQRHTDDLAGDRTRTGPVRPPARVRTSALTALTFATAAIARLSTACWSTVRIAVEHGARLADIATALDEDGDVEIVVERFRTYLDALSIDGGITDDERAALERRLPSPGHASPDTPDRPTRR